VEQISSELKEKLGRQVANEAAGVSRVKQLDWEDQKMIYDDMIKLEEIGVALVELGFSSEDIVVLRHIFTTYENRQH